MSARIVLTGSSGNLGTYLLDDLIQSSNVDRVWCLNRSSDAGERQATLLAARGLPSTIPGLVEFHQYDCASEELGLPSAVYHDIGAHATHILHVAWPVDWNKSFASFESSIRGVRQLIELCVASTLSPHLFFVSSVAAAGNWGAIPGAREKVPEEEIDDWKVARLGYGQSKLVAERLLAEASRAHGITTAICRVGQVAGPVDRGTQGVWPRQEWLPSLIASSKYLGVLPDFLGPGESVDWVPVDRLSAIMTQLLFLDKTSGTALFYHIANPHPVEWRSLVTNVKEALDGANGDGDGDGDGDGGGDNKLAAAARPIRITNLVEWTAILEASAQDEEAEVSQNPAVKLLSFFQNLKDKTAHLPKARAATLEVKHTMMRCSKMQEMGPVNQQWMSLWMKQWDFV